MLSKLAQHHDLVGGCLCEGRYLWLSTRGHLCCLMVGWSSPGSWKGRLHLCGLTALCVLQCLRPPIGFVSVPSVTDWRWWAEPISVSWCRVRFLWQQFAYAWSPLFAKVSSSWLQGSQLWQLYHAIHLKYLLGHASASYDIWHVYGKVHASAWHDMKH